MTGGKPLLLSCPFCGDKADYQYEEGSWGYYPPTVSISCTGCGVRRGRFAVNDDPAQKLSRKEAEKKAADLWNTRHIMAARRAVKAPAL